MDESRKKIIIVILCSLGMTAFIYFEFIPETDKGNTDDFVNPAQLDDSPSKREIYDQRRKQKRQEFNFDRKVSSLENFLKNQIEKDPFGDPSSHKVTEEQIAQVNETPKVKERIVTISRSVEKGKREDIDGKLTASESFEEVKQNNERRRVGFASGGNKKSKTERPEKIAGVKALTVVHEDVRVKSGSGLKLRIIESFQIGSVTVPENTFVTGKVSFSGDRIYIDVKSISVNGQLLTTKLTAYDLNGSKGIYVEGGLEKEIKSDALEQTVSEVQRNVTVPFLGRVPFSSAKKKIREPEIPITAGHKIYLRNQ